MTSVLVWSPYYPPSMGGLQSHAQEFNRHLAARGYTVTVFTPRLPASAVATEMEGPAVTVIRYPAFELIPNWPLPRLWRWQFWQQLAPLWRHPADLIIARTRFFATTWLARIFAYVVHRPYIHIEHGADYVQFRHPAWQHLGRTIDRTIGRRVVRSATKVIANSAQTAAFIGTLAPGVEATVIYRGIEAAAIENVVPLSPPSGTLPRKIRIGYFGRLIAGKGIADFIESLPALAQYPVEAVIVGDGPDRTYLTGLVKKLSLTSTVTFVPNTNWSRAIALLKDCDIIVNPSYTEGLPTIVIEAALCRKAIVATDVGGTREIIQHGRSGLLVPPRKREAFREALEKLIVDSELRQQLGEQAYRDVAGKYEWSEAIEKYHDIFMKVLP